MSGDPNDLRYDTPNITRGDNMAEQDWNDLSPLELVEAIDGWAEEWGETTRFPLELLTEAKKEVNSDAYDVLLATYSRLEDDERYSAQCWREDVALHTPQHLPLLDKWIRHAADIVVARDWKEARAQKYIEAGPKGEER